MGAIEKINVPILEGGMFRKKNPAVRKSTVQALMSKLADLEARILKLEKKPNEKGGNKDA